MSGAGDQGPRKLDKNDMRNYKEMGSTQAASAKDKVQAVNEKAKMRNTNSTRPQATTAESSTADADSGGGFANWRTGNFGTNKKSAKGAGGPAP